MAAALNFPITADDQTKAAFESVRRNLDQIRKSAEDVQGGFAGFKAAAVGAIAAISFGAVISGIRGLINEFDDLLDQAEQVGVAAERFQALAVGAELSGAKAEDLKAALTKVAQNAFDAASGNETLAEQFRAMGVAVVDSTGKLRDTESIFLDLVDQISRLDDGIAKTGIGIDLIGKSFTKFTNGAADIRAAADEANRLNLVVSEATQNVFAKFNDTLFIVARQIKSLIAEAIAPAVKWFTSLLEKVKNFFSIGKAGGDKIKEMADANRDAASAAQQHATSLQAVNKATSSLPAPIAKTSSMIAAQKKASEELAKTLRDVESVTSDVVYKIAEQTEKALDQDVKEVLKQFGEDSKEALKKYQLAQDAASEELAYWRKETEAVRTPMEQFNDRMEILNDALQRGLISFQAYEGLSGKAFETFSKAIEAPKDGLEEIRALLDKTGESFTETFTQMLMTGKASFKSLVDSIISDLLRLYIKQKITVPLFDALKTIDFGSIFTKRAVGGPVKGGRPYMVGEKGPELFVPGASGSIVRNQDVSAGSGGGDVIINQTLQITTGVQSTVRAEIAQLMPQIANVTKAAIVDARARGGSFAAALR